MSIKDRLRRLEVAKLGGPGCPECRRTPTAPRVFYPGQGDPEPEPERCPKCGRTLGPLIAVVYEGEAEPGGGGLT